MDVPWVCRYVFSHVDLAMESLRTIFFLSESLLLLLPEEVLNDLDPKNTGIPGTLGALAGRFPHQQWYKCLAVAQGTGRDATPNQLRCPGFCQFHAGSCPLCAHVP